MKAKVDQELDGFSRQMLHFKDELVPDRINHTLEIFEDKIKLLQAAIKLDLKRKLEPMNKTQESIKQILLRMDEQKNKSQADKKELQTKFEKMESTTGNLKEALLMQVQRKIEEQL